MVVKGYVSVIALFLFRNVWKIISVCRFITLFVQCQEGQRILMTQLEDYKVNKSGIAVALKYLGWMSIEVFCGCCVLWRVWAICVGVEWCDRVCCGVIECGVCWLVCGVVLCDVVLCDGVDVVKSMSLQVFIRRYVLQPNWIVGATPCLTIHYYDEVAAFKACVDLFSLTFSNFSLQKKKT